MTPYLPSRSREVLGECTGDWASAPLDPLEAASSFWRRMGSDALKYTNYNGSSVTAGGAKRFPDWAMPEVVNWNTETSLQYADYLHRMGKINLQLSIDAVALGYIPSWGQNDYLEFWLSIMARPDLSAANIEAIRTQMDAFYNMHDMNLFSNSKATHDERRPLYQAFGRAFHQALEGIETRPIDTITQLIDRKLSLGSDVEAQFAYDQRIGVKAPAYNGTQEGFLAVIDRTELRDRLAAIHQAGANFVEQSDTPGLSLASLADVRLG